MSYKDGGDTPVIDCPYCYNGSYLYYEGICVACGESAIHECKRCSANIPPEEISDDNVCGYCAHMWAKIMEE